MTKPFVYFRDDAAKYAAIFSALLLIAATAGIFAVGFIPDRTCKAVDLVQAHRTLQFNKGGFDVYTP